MKATGDDKKQSSKALPGLLKKQLTYDDGDGEMMPLYRSKSIGIKYKRPTIDNLFNEKESLGLKAKGTRIRKTFTGGLASKLSMRRTETVKKQNALASVKEVAVSKVQKRRVTKLLEIKEDTSNPSVKRGSMIK